jgi:hypothetical protein
MDGASINFLAIPTALLLALAGGPVALRRAGYLWSKTLFGSLTLAAAGLGVAGIISSIQAKAGIPELPLAWVAPVLVVIALVRLARLRVQE